jgi:hypothetical protein
LLKIILPAYQDNGQAKKAVQLLEQVVAIEARTLAKDHPSRLASQHALVIAYQDLAGAHQAMSEPSSPIQALAIGAVDSN